MAPAVVNRLLNSLLFALCVALLVGASSAFAARVPPPGNVLQHPRNQVVVGDFRETLSDGRYRFDKLENLRGPDSAPTEITLRAPLWLAQWLRKGDRYLFAYSNYIPNPRFPRDYLIDTDGPSLITALGMEPALFRDAPELRANLLHPVDAKTLHSDQFVETVIAGLGSSDTQMQNFFAAELTQRPELSEHPSRDLIATVKALLSNPDGHPSARAGLLRLVADQPDIYGRRTIAKLVPTLLAQASLVGYQNSAAPAGDLVRTALELARLRSLAVPLPTLQRLVACDSAAISEAALLAIRESNPKQERTIALAALEQTQLPASTREFLLDHLRRLNLMAGAKMQTEPVSK